MRTNAKRRKVCKLRVLTNFVYILYIRGWYKTWTLDSGLDHRLDYGLEYGPKNGLDYGLKTDSQSIERRALLHKPSK